MGPLWDPYGTPPGLFFHFSPPPHLILYSAHVFNAFARLHPRLVALPFSVSFRPETMPAKHKSGSKRNRPVNRKPRSKKHGKMSMVYVPPSSKKVTLVFAEQNQIVEGAAGTGAFQFYRLNSAYDVDTSVGSTSTPGFAEWSTFFTNYRVWRTRVRIEGNVNNLTQGGIGTVSLIPNPLQPTLPSSAVSWPVQYGAIHQTVNNLNSGGHNLIVLDKQFSLPTVFRITPSQYKNEFDFSATTTTNPTRQAYVAVAMKSYDSGTVAGFSYQIYVSMEVEFFNNVLLAS
jgi:hypothetical protein